MELLLSFLPLITLIIIVALLIFGIGLYRSKRAVQTSNVQPVWHFVLLSIATFEIYVIYWFYRNWQHLKLHKNLNISPGWRTAGLFVPIYGIVLVYRQLRDIRQFSKEAGINKTYSTGWILFGWIILGSLVKLPDPFWLLYLLSVWPLAVVQGVLNSYWEKEQSELPGNKSKRVKATYGAGFIPEKQTLHIPKPPFKNRQEYETWKAAKFKKSEKVSQEPPARQPEFSLEISCPHCQEKISKDSIKCKYCAEDVRDYQKAETDKIAIALNQSNKAEQPIISSNASSGEKIDSLLDLSQPINNTKADLKNKLGRLDEIFKEGIISEQEYKTKKEKLLEEFLSN